MRKGQSYLKGAAALSLGGFISKLIGAFYRIPLVAILGGGGMGIYQLAYPLYAVFLTLTSSGISVGLARLISGGGKVDINRAFAVFGGLGFIASLAMFLLAPLFQSAYGEDGIALCCRLLSPSVFFVALISVVRGYFQGLGNMYPTAFSEVFEQGLKACLGIALAGMFRENAAGAAAAAIFAVTLSEAATCAVMLIFCLARREIRPLYFCARATYAQVFLCSVPLTLSAVAAPLSQFFESFVAVRLLRTAHSDAAALYGIFSGCALSLVNLPASITYGLAAASVPHISPYYSRGDITGAKRIAARALSITLALAFCAAAGLYVLSPAAVKIIFPSLSAEHKLLLVRLVKTMCFGSVFSAVAQTSAAALSSLGKPYLSACTQWLCGGLRVALTSSLIAFTRLSITSAAISANACYFVAVTLNLCYIIGVKKRGRTPDTEDNYVGNADRFRGKGRRFNPFRV